MQVRTFAGTEADMVTAITMTHAEEAIHAVDADKGLLLVKGAVPGPRGGIVLVRAAVKGA